MFLTLLNLILSSLLTSLLFRLFIYLFESSFGSLFFALFHFFGDNYDHYLILCLGICLIRSHWKPFLWNESLGEIIVSFSHCFLGFCVGVYAYVFKLYFLNHLYSFSKSVCSIKELAL